MSAQPQNIRPAPAMTMTRHAGSPAASSTAAAIWSTKPLPAERAFTGPLDRRRTMVSPSRLFSTAMSVLSEGFGAERHDRGFARGDADRQPLGLRQHPLGEIVRHGALRAVPQRVELGRASGRARVRPVGYIPVGAGALQK